MTILSILVMAVVIGFAGVACSRNRWKWRVVVVEGIRVALVTLAVALLWQPESEWQVESDRKSEVVLLVDRSGSMQTTDVLVDGESLPRQVIADEAIANDAWQGLDGRFQVVEQAFADEADAISDLAAAIEGAGERFESAAAIVLVSDGDWNGGQSPVRSAVDLAKRSGGNTRIDVVPVGGSERLPDLELASADVPTFAVVDKPVRIPFSIRNWFPHLRDVTVSLRQDDRVVQQQTVSIRSGGRFDGSFTWQSETAGSFALAVDVPVDQGEFNAENNRLEKRIEVRKEKLRVLLIEGVPRWEYRYLRNALLRDPGIDVSCLLFHPDLPSIGGGGRDYLPSFPDEPAELASYDVIFLGDVGVDAEMLTVQQCSQIRGLVEQQAVGLVLMPGPRGRHASLDLSDLGELYPVVLDASSPSGIGNQTPATLALTGAGRGSLLTELEDDDQSNWLVWESLPGFYWHAAVTRAKAGSEVLAVHAETANQYGRLPLLVSRAAGAGKVLFVGTDAAWRWRMGVEDKYHYRFWGQAIRWMAYQRNMAVGETMRLSYRPERPRPGETLSLRASVMQSGGTPSDADAAWIDVVGPSGSKQRIRLDKVDSEWGVYAGQTRFEQAGEYDLSLNHPLEQSTVQARVAVQGRAGEQIGRPARPDVMREIAKVAGGQVFAADQVQELVDQLNALPPDPREIQRIEWWNHPAVLLGLVLGLGGFWIGRKWVGAV